MIPKSFVTALAVLAIAGCGSTAASTQAAPQPKPSATVTVVSDPATIGAYTSATVNVKVGDTVEWVFKDLNPHTASADAGSPQAFSSNVLAGGKTYRHTFAVAGTYNYHCAIHPEMHGSVVVS